MKLLARAKHTWRKFYDYMRYDFKEIAFPSAMPDPPGTVEETRKLTWNDYVLILKVATRVYIKSFNNPDNNPEVDIKEEIDLVKNPGKERRSKEKKPEPKEPSTLEDLAVAAKAGSEHIRPALHRIYMTKASAYKDAVKSFVVGYQEGLTEVLNPNNTGEFRSNNTTNDTKDSPGMKEKNIKAEAKETDVAANVGMQHPPIDGIEAKTEIKANDEKKDKNTL